MFGIEKLREEVQELRDSLEEFKDQFREYRESELTFKEVSKLINNTMKEFLDIFEESGHFDKLDEILKRLPESTKEVKQIKVKVNKK